MPEENPEHVGNQAVNNTIADLTAKAALETQELVARQMALAAGNVAALAPAIVTACTQAILGVSDTAAEKQQDIKAAQTTNPQTGQPSAQPLG